MKKYIFYIPLNDDNLGGSIWIKHIGDTLAQMGQDVRYCHYESDTSAGDYTIIQSEWIEKPAYLTSRRAIVLLGHFTKVVYPDPYKIRPRDIILTQWKGEVIEKFERESGLKTHYFPHGYYNYGYLKVLDDELQRFVKNDGVWIGSDTPFRDISRFCNLDIRIVKDAPQELVSEYYRAVKVCPNVHLNIQKGEMVNVPESVIDTPGFAVNERLFWICGAGGFQIADDNPLVRDFYDEDEVPMATAEDFNDIFLYYLDHPEERLKMAKKAQERTLKEHTYQHRITNILLPLCKN